MLTPTHHQIARYRLFGFEVFQGAAGPFVDSIFTDVGAVHDAGVRLRGHNRRRSSADFLGSSAAMAATAATLDLLGLASRLLGSPATYLFGDASEYHGD